MVSEEKKNVCALMGLSSNLSNSTLDKKNSVVSRSSDIVTEIEYVSCCWPKLGNRKQAIFPQKLIMGWS